MANTALHRSLVGLLTNKSGGSVAQGDVVIVDAANASAFTTTTTSSYASGSIGVVLEPNGIASNAIGLIAFGGFVPIVNLSSSAALGDVFHTHSVAKQAIRHAAPVTAGDFGQVLGTGTTPAAFLWGQPALAGTTLAGLSDASISTPANLQQLQYQTGDSKWHNVGGGMVQLFDSLLGGTQATFAPSSLGGYSHLKIYVYSRTTSATNGTDTLLVTANGDTAANYNWEELIANTTTASAVNAGSVTSMQLGFATSGGSAAGLFDVAVIEVTNYGSTTGHKLFRSQATRNFGLGAGNLILVDLAGYWASTAAITSLTFTPGSGSFATGSRCTVYGLV